MKVLKIINFRKGLATNSSSTHSIIYKNKDDMFGDLNIFEEIYYNRFTETIAVSKKAKIKYILSNILWYDSLIKLLELKYPEVKEYYPLIKKTREALKGDFDYDVVYDNFGCCNRGSLVTEENLEFDFEYITKVIEDPELVIVGGSDECDFYYDTTRDHQEYLTTPYRYYRKGELSPIIQKNGTYWFSLASNKSKYDLDVQNNLYSKIRFSLEDHPVIPEYPELIDLKLTNKCNHGCPFCFMDSKMTEEHADPNKIKRIINSIQNPTEFSIGGGNILLYPHLTEVLKYIYNRKHIINITINEKDCKAILENPTYEEALEYVHGIGISIVNLNDIEHLKLFAKRYTGKKYLTLHFIPELLGSKKCIEFINTIKNNEISIYDYLFLGYKTNGRGNKNIKKLNNTELNELFNTFKYVSIDTSFANTYLDYLKDNFYIDKSITLTEGEFSMYIDGITGFMYKSSYQLDKPYTTDWGYKESTSVIYKNTFIDVFEAIRQDNNLPIYSEYQEDKFYNK